jgi:hypothetical protein
MTTPSYLGAIVNSDSQNTGGRSVEIAGLGGGSLMGLAPVTVAHANSRIASPEKTDFFMIPLPSLEWCRAVADVDHVRT